MKVTEHYGNFPPDWQYAEIEALMSLVKGQMIKDENDKFTRMFYAKIYGKLMAMKHETL
jgi:hypothetical protein